MSQVITPAEFHQRLTAEPGLVLLDVRTPVEFDAVRVPQARNVPLNELDSQALMAGNVIHNGQPVYVICHSGSRSKLAADTLKKDGLANVVQIEGGTLAWEKAGLPVQRGETGGISIERQVRIGAGSLVLTGILLGYFVHPYLLGLSAFVGAGLVFAGITDWCGMGLLLAKAPWNQRKTT